MYTISTEKGLVLTVHALDHNGKKKTDFDMLVETSQRLKNLNESGDLLDESLKVIASFDWKGVPIIQHHVPYWLKNIIGNREKLILSHVRTKFLQVDCDGERLPDYQQIAETPNGISFTIDTKKRSIIN